jgi:uncharacterized membrane protein YkoI
MKQRTTKLILTAAVLGAISVPSMVMAHSGSDDAITTVATHQEDHPVKTSAAASTNISETSTMLSSDDNAQASVQTPSGTVSLKIETHTPANSIQPFEAATVAQKVFPNKSIAKIELENEENVVVYSVRFADGSRVDINATDSSVVRQRDNASTTSNSGRRGDDDQHDDRSGRGSDDN